jgi:hypothetical protein
MAPAAEAEKGHAGFYFAILLKSPIFRTIRMSPFPFSSPSFAGGWHQSQAEESEHSSNLCQEEVAFQLEQLSKLSNQT